MIAAYITSAKRLWWLYCLLVCVTLILRYAGMTMVKTGQVGVTALIMSILIDANRTSDFRTMLRHFSVAVVMVNLIRYAFWFNDVSLTVEPVFDVLVLIACPFCYWMGRPKESS